MSGDEEELPETFVKHGHSTNVSFIGEKRHNLSSPLAGRHLVKKPRVRQWIHNRVVYRTKDDFTASSFELVFDLLYAGVIHQLAEASIEPKPSGPNIAKFLLTFYPSWSIWADQRTFINQCGTDDLLQRMLLLINMILLVGYSSNATSIELEQNEEGHWEFGHGSYNALHAATGFVIVASGIRFIRLLIYAAWLPKFRASFLASSVFAIIAIAVFIPLFFVHSFGAIIALPVVCFGIELFGPIFGVSFASLMQNRAVKGQAKPRMVPAINIEHSVERLTAFTVIVLGEAVINVTYSARLGQVGVHSEYGRACLGVIICFILAWLYFTQAAARRSVHAYRRHFLSSVLFSQLHFPLTAALILVGASMAEFVSDNEPPQGLRWYFSGGLSVALFCIFLLGLTHQPLDAPKSAIVPRIVRLITRFLGSIIIVLLPLKRHLTSTKLMGIDAGVFAFIVIVDTFGLLGSYIPQDTKKQKAAVGVSQDHDGVQQHEQEDQDDQHADAFVEEPEEAVLNPEI